MENFINYNYLIAFLISFLATLVITPFCIIFIKKLGLWDDPKKRNHPGVLHKIPIPRGGGIPLFLGIFLVSLFFLPLNKTIILLFAASIISLIIGVIDDKFDISPFIRLSFNFLCATIVVFSGITIPFITNPLGGILHLDAFKIIVPFLNQDLILSLSDFLAIIWIMWVMNMLNWSKGVDGQMPGVLAISAIIIGILSLRFQSLDSNSIISAKLSFIIAGSSLGFLIFNFHPAKIFPGYGATSVYLLLAVVSILSSVKIATAVIVMGMPMADGVFTILRRILSKKSPFKSDNKHLYHLLLKTGFSKRKTALFYWFVSAILGIIALALNSWEKLLAIIIISIFVGAILLFLHLFLRYKNERNALP